MNERELKRLFPRISESTLRVNKDNLEDQGARKCSVVQNKEEGSLEKAQGRINVSLGLDPERRKTMDAASNPKFEITIDYLFSSYGGSDPDGALSTILDCLEDAAQGLTALDWQDNSQSDQGA